jgi:hypothetical protein
MGAIGGGGSSRYVNPLGSLAGSLWAWTRTVALAGDAPPATIRTEIRRRCDEQPADVIPQVTHPVRHELPFSCDDYLLTSVPVRALMLDNWFEG